MRDDYNIRDNNYTRMSNIYIAVSDRTLEYVKNAFESIRICYGIEDVYDYEMFIDNVNKNSNFHHEVTYEQIHEKVYNAKYVALAYSGCKRNIYTPYIKTARLFKDVESAKSYLLTLHHKYGAIIEIDKLEWDYDDHICDGNVYLFPDAVDIDKDAILINIKKTQKSVYAQKMAEYEEEEKREKENTSAAQNEDSTITSSYTRSDASSDSSSDTRSDGDEIKKGKGNAESGLRRRRIYKLIKTT